MLPYDEMDEEYSGKVEEPVGARNISDTEPSDIVDTPDEPTPVTPDTLEMDSTTPRREPVPTKAAGKREGDRPRRVKLPLIIAAAWIVLIVAILPIILPNLIFGTPTGDNDRYIYFGEYPRSLKAADVMISDVKDARGYYLGSDGAYYAALTATPEDDGYKFADGTLIESGVMYYFKVEPIRWRILKCDEGTALLFCDSIIDTSIYADYRNNYENSILRGWLNADFYTTAFNDEEKKLIPTTLVDNSQALADTSQNPYLCPNTEDKVFLLSYGEIINPDYGFSESTGRVPERIYYTTDYARARGNWVSQEEGNYGASMFWLRTPSAYQSDFQRVLGSDGEVTGSTNVAYPYGGVAPAITVDISVVDADGTP